MEVEADQTLLAFKEFNRLLGKMEKDLRRTARNLQQREVAQSARFVVDGIHEAQNYLAIVTTVIPRTRLIMSKRNLHEPVDLDPETRESHSAA